MTQHKLTGPQIEALRQAVRSACIAGAFYRPTQKLLDLGLVVQDGTTQWGHRYVATEAGRAVLANGG